MPMHETESAVAELRPLRTLVSRLEPSARKRVITLLGRGALAHARKARAATTPGEGPDHG
jgi:hypothetical protein